MIGIQVNIIEYTDDHQPGWVRCQFIDAYGKIWYMVDKVPMFITTENLDAKSSYPVLATIPVTVTEIFLNNDLIELALIDTNMPWGIWAEGGEFMFTVLKSQLFDVRNV
jgi:hypothetical protein